MAEASFIPPTADVMPIASGASVAPANAAADGIFAGMLAQRLQPQAEGGAQARQAVRAVEPAASATAVPVKPAPAETANSGQASPQPGNALPQDAEAGVVSREQAGVGLAELDQAVLSPPEDNAPVLLLDDAQLLVAQALPVTQGVGGVALTAESSAAAALPGGVIDAANQAQLSAGAVLTANPNGPVAELKGSQKPLVAEARTVPLKAQANAALPLATALEGAANAAQESARQPAASLGLNASYATGEQLRSNNAALAAEQAIRSRALETPVTQVQTGDALSRQLQQQIDRLLVTSRASVDTTPATTSLFSAPAVDSLAGTPAEAALNTLLPSFSTDLRAAAPLGSLAGMSVPVATPVGQPGWSADLGQRMLWLANQDIREAQIQLNPRNLGPIDVRIVYSDAQQLSVSFNAQNPAAREALDAALPRLREMFEQQGLSLGDASVSQESFAQQQQDSDAQDEYSAHAQGGRISAGTEHLDGEISIRPPPITLGEGLLDTFA